VAVRPSPFVPILAVMTNELYDLGIRNFDAEIDPKRTTKLSVKCCVCP
jgi:hypothetical protein